MQSVGITSVFKQYEIKCPNCDWPHWCTVGQYNKQNSLVCSFCDLKFKIDKPIKIKEDNENINKKSIKLNENANIAIQSMIDIGYSKKEAETKISKIFDIGKSIEILIKDAVSQ